MNTPRKKTNFLTALGTAFLLATAPLAQAQVFDDWDANDDGNLDDTEFNEGFASTDYYDDWDADDDGILDDDELGDGLFDTWDANDDDIIDTNEYNYGLYDEFGDDYAEFSSWDTDGNNEISDDEFDEAYNNSGIYNNWDSDGNNEINDTEATEGVFSWFDDNDDDYVDEDEWATSDDVFADYM